MNKTDFLAQPEVESFIDWLVTNLPAMVFNLDFAHSKFVPGGLRATVTGFDNLLDHYRWKANWTDWKSGATVVSDDWRTTQASLARLQREILGATKSGSSTDALKACLAVLQWGGVSGSVTFLMQHHARGTLLSYLNGVKPLLDLTGTQKLSNITSHSVTNFDAGLTKVFSLQDMSGSPIFDSRVGAAIACLYEIFHRQTKNGSRHLLNFPSGGARGKQIRNPGKLGVGFRSAPQFYTTAVPPHVWAQNQLKLGWVIEAVLNRATWFGGEASFPDRCQEFQACLFVAGYDLRAFLTSTGITTVPVPGPVATSAGEALTTPVKIVVAPVTTLPAIDTEYTWVPTGHSFPDVLDKYLGYISQLDAGKIPTSSDFVAWLKAHNVAANTAKTMCYPLGPNEFDLFGRSLADIETIRAGGEIGLKCALQDHIIDNDEHDHVCMVDVWLAGRLSCISRPERNAILMALGYAGTEGACDTLMYVGRKIGVHFALIKPKPYQPTPFFKTFFSGLYKEMSLEIENYSIEKGMTGLDRLS